jgi:uncharacterized protein YndB with AHSA1/START domain
MARKRATAATKKVPASPSISDEAVRRATGHAWTHWFAILDEFREAEDHTARARHLRDAHGLAPWWSQTVALQFERARGHRVLHQRSDGVLEINVERTVPVGVADAFDAWTDAKRIGTWFSTNVSQDVRVGGTYRNGDGDRGTFLAVDRPRRLRFTWDNPEHAPGSIAEVTFRAKGPKSTAVRVTHAKLPSAKAVEGLRRGWTWALTSLRSYLETGKPIPYEKWLSTLSPARDAKRATTSKTRRPRVVRRKATASARA